MLELSSQANAISEIKIRIMQLEILLGSNVLTSEEFEKVKKAKPIRRFSESSCLGNVFLLPHPA
jgi:hypothetical protein